MKRTLAGSSVLVLAILLALLLAGCGGGDDETDGSERDRASTASAGTESAVDPYIRPGGYFLALKLLPGRSTGDLTPVVLEYASELPMIPLILTSVGATPNMGVQVWLLGNARAIPRNYHHVVLNEALFDWQNQVQNYNDVVIAAVGEAPGRHDLPDRRGDAGGRRGPLGDVADALPVVVLVERRPEESDLPADERTQADERSHEGRLAGAVGAHQRDELALGDGEVDPAQHRSPAEGDAAVLDDGSGYDVRGILGHRQPLAVVRALRLASMRER